MMTGPHYLEHSGMDDSMRLAKLACSFTFHEENKKYQPSKADCFDRAVNTE